MNARRIGAMGLAGLVAALGLGACGGDDGGSVRSGGDRNEQPPTPGNDSAESYVGLSKRAAIAQAEADDRPWRILREDDEFFPATMDFVENRVNFEIDDGEVTQATFG